MRSRLTKLASIAAVLVVFCLALSGGASRVLSSTIVLDDFNDNFLDQARWTSTTSGGFSAISETNQRIELTHSSGRTSLHSGFAGILGKCTIRGDFDIQLDFNLLNWPPNNAQKFSLVASPLFWMERVYADQDYYMSSLGSGPIFVPTTDMTGKMRIQRVGSEVTTFYHDNGSWVEAATRTGVPTTEIHFNITSSYDSGNPSPGTIVATADSAIVSAGVLACHLNGDLDCNGRVSHFDALDAVMAEAGTPVIWEGCPTIGSGIGQPASGQITGPTIFGDVNCDGSADALDLLPILRYFAELPTGLPETCTPVGQYIQLAS